MPKFKKNTSPAMYKPSAFKMKGSTLYGSPLNKKGPIQDFFKAIGKLWDQRTDKEKQKATEEYATLNIQSELRRKDLSSVPKSHIDAIKNIGN